MPLQLHQSVSASGYFTDALYLHGTIGDFETNLGYHYGRLQSGFFIAHLSVLPDIDDFEIAGYSITPQHRFEKPAGFDMKILKAMAKEKMFETGARHLVKIFPKTRHNDSMDLSEQYPFGKGGIPQWNLVKKLPMHIFKEVEAGHKGNIYLA